MLAPRKKLWSTPPEVLDVAIELLDISKTDVVYDIGAGDCNFLIECHKRTGASCIGIEIDDDRAERARIRILELGYTESQCLVITGNALDQVPSIVENPYFRCCSHYSTRKSDLIFFLYAYLKYHG